MRDRGAFASRKPLPSRLMTSIGLALFAIVLLATILYIVLEDTFPSQSPVNHLL